MAEQWIAAHQAYNLVPDTQILCARLHAGLIRSRARLFKRNDEARENYDIPDWFWWVEGRGAFEADWKAGDFATWIECKDHCRAFGVELALSGVLELLPIVERAVAVRQLSVAGNQDWLTAKAARQLAYSSLGYAPGAAGDAIIELARLGLAFAKAVLAEGSGARGSAGSSWQEYEWDIPTWFWSGFASSPDGRKDWEQGRFTTVCSSPSGPKRITVSGVHLLRASLIPNGQSDVPKETALQAKRGRKPSYDWDAVVTAVWGQLLRGELIPDHQADIERAMVKLLSVGDKEPSVSTVRPYASRIWNEFSKA
jgi:hypothetical protein